MLGWTLILYQAQILVVPNFKAIAKGNNYTGTTESTSKTSGHQESKKAVHTEGEQSQVIAEIRSFQVLQRNGTGKWTACVRACGSHLGP